jgi:hypothetical protein
LVGTPKPTLTDPFMLATGTSGFINPLTLNVAIASDVLWFERPFNLAHEWSHVAAYAREDEANYLAIVTCLRSLSAAKTTLRASRVRPTRLAGFRGHAKAGCSAHQRYARALVVAHLQRLLEEQSDRIGDRQLRRGDAADTRRAARQRRSADQPITEQGPSRVPAVWSDDGG